MKAVVMAGGFGTRIQPLTSGLPKPMIPVCNRPMMEYAVSALKKLGITEIVILLYFKPDIIKSYFGDGRSFGVKIHYITPDDDYGTAGAVKQAAHLLDERFIVVSGDLITDINFQEVLGYHEAKDSLATITLTSVSDPLQFGVVITDKGGKILRFLEKPGWGEVFSDTINTGIYIFEPEVLNHIPESRNFDFSKDLFPALMSKGINLYGYNAKGYWRDVGNPDSYRSCMQDISSGIVKLNIPGEKTEIDGAVCYLGHNVHIAKDAKLSGMIVIGDNSTVEKGVTIENCSIGSGCKIAGGSRVSSTVMWDGVFIDKDCNIVNAVICNNVKIGTNVEAHKGAVIADNTEVGNRVVFDKDVTVWPDKQIESGSILSSNLIWGDKWKSSIFEGGKVTARTNVELSPEMSAKLGAAFGSILPAGAKLLVSRDYHRASRMLKRAFLGGLLSTGVNASDLHQTAVPVNRYKLSTFGEVGGVHFRQHYMDPTHTEILFYDENGNILDSGKEKQLERIFFRDHFRRAPHDEVGEIIDQRQVFEYYREGVLNMLDIPALKAARIKVVANLMNGASGEILPDLLNKIGADAIILNAYEDEAKLSRTFSQFVDSERQTSEITTALGAEAGLIIYPAGERFILIANNGKVLKNEELLIFILLLLDKCSSPGTKVYLPVYAPTVMDTKLVNLEVVRGKFTGVKGSFLKDFSFSGSIDGLFSFNKHIPFNDAIYASLKVLEMLSKQNKSLSELYDEIPEYKYYHTVISCPLDLKGYLMRRMSEEAMDKDSSFVDGVKISYKSSPDENIYDSWLHMLPDQYSPSVHLYVEGATQDSAARLHDKYVKLINMWLGGAGSSGGEKIVEDFSQ